MLGLALGCIGMSREDFAQCTPDEFQAIYDEWYEREENRMHGLWEAVRFAGIIATQPYARSPMKAEDMTFSWEKKNNGTDAAETKGASDLDRMKKLSKKVGYL